MCGAGQAAAVDTTLYLLHCLCILLDFSLLVYYSRMKYDREIADQKSNYCSRFSSNESINSNTRGQSRASKDNNNVSEFIVVVVTLLVFYV